MHDIGDQEEERDQNRQNIEQNELEENENHLVASVDNKDTYKRENLRTLEPGHSSDSLINKNEN